MQEKRIEAFCEIANKTVQIKIFNDRTGLSEYAGHMRTMQYKCRYNSQCGINIRYHCKVIKDIIKDEVKRIDEKFVGTQLLTEDDPEKWDF